MIFLRTRCQAAASLAIVFLVASAPGLLAAPRQNADSTTAPAGVQQAPAVSVAPTAPTILFVTQPPFPKDFATVNAVFGNHVGATYATPRGGDLWIRYGNGMLRNLTEEAGFGLDPAAAIAVREPCVHWSGKKALFSMVVGGSVQNVLTPVHWQIYEVSGLDPTTPVSIVKLPQPATSNNVSPIYGTDDRILFTTDLPRNGNMLLFPQLDEYESTASNTGIWSMERDGSDLRLLDHSVSGDFSPFIASDGRVIFSRWDHLQRDPLNLDGMGPFGAYNYASESSATKLAKNVEQFPEPFGAAAVGPEKPHAMNVIFPWQMNEDGSGLETLNHVGRHELLDFVSAATYQLPDFFVLPGTKKTIGGFLLQLKEDPLRPGRFIGVSAPEFLTHAAGQIVAFDAAEGKNAEDIVIEALTHPITEKELPNGQPMPPHHPGLFRSPSILSDGALIAVRTTSGYADKALAGSSKLDALYDFHLTTLVKSGAHWVPGARLVPGGIHDTIAYWDNFSFQQITYSGPLWELDPVEVRARPVPEKHADPLPDPERAVLASVLGGHDAVSRLRAYLTAHRLALLSCRDVTRRADLQQEVNLKIAGTTKQTAMPGATPAKLSWAQFIQADALRGYSNTSFSKGRRAIGVPMHDAENEPVAGAPKGAVDLFDDGSFAALVPASRAMSWQLLDPDSKPVVRERYWVTFAPGEIRACSSCHGINKTDVVLNQPPPMNEPKALRHLLQWWNRSTRGGTVGDTVGVFNPTNHRLVFDNGNDGGAADLSYTLPAPGPSAIPIAGDWNGNGIDAPGFYVPATAQFYLYDDAAPGSLLTSFEFGIPGYSLEPIAGDWDGDGTDSIGVYDSATGYFVLRDSNSSGGADVAFVFGPVGARAVVGDWDGDGRDSVGVHVGATGAWMLRNDLSPGPPDATFLFPAATPDEVPVAGDWNADARDSAGFHRRSTGLFRLKNGFDDGHADLQFGFGPAGGIAITGDWNGG